MEKSPKCLVFQKERQGRNSARQKYCYKNYYYKTILNMSNENPNNTPHWRNKLDELENLPGSAFNRDAAWDKLYGRFQGNNKSKKIFWYWIAAACLLLGLMITILNHQKTTPQASAKETAIKQAKEIKKRVLKVEEVNKNENENSA